MSIVPEAGLSFRMQQADAPIFRAVLEPNASLSSGGLMVVFIAGTAVAAIFSLMLVLAGLWLGAVFLVFNTAFLCVALQAARADRVRAEEVVVGREGITITRFNRRRCPVQVERLPLYGLTIHGDVDPDYGLLSVAVGLRHRRIEVARDLGPAERQHFLDALLQAMASAGCPPRQSMSQRLPLLSETSG